MAPGVGHAHRRQAQAAPWQVDEQNQALNLKLLCRQIVAPVAPVAQDADGDEAETNHFATKSPKNNTKKGSGAKGRRPTNAFKKGGAHPKVPAKPALVPQDQHVTRAEKRAAKKQKPAVKAVKPVSRIAKPKAAPAKAVSKKKEPKYKAPLALEPIKTPSNRDGSPLRGNKRRRIALTPAGDSSEDDAK